MGKVTIDINRCKGCRLCVNCCPKGILTMSKDCNVNGYYYAEANEEGKCTGCLFCVKVCPDICLEIGCENEGLI